MNSSLQVISLVFGKSEELSGIKSFIQFYQDKQNNKGNVSLSIQ
jgi:hypothetical protein